MLELALGILIGPEVLDWAEADAYVTFLSRLGLAMLFFMAGLEVVEKKVPRGELQRGTMGWFVSLAVGMVAGYTAHALGMNASGWLVGIVLTTTALGTLVPILSDAGVLSRPVGGAVLGTGVSGEFWPIVVISVFLTGTYGAGTEIVLLIVFGLLVAAGVATALRARPPRIVRVIQETIHTTGQAAVRLSLLVLAALSSSPATAASTSSSAPSRPGSSSASRSTGRAASPSAPGSRGSPSASSSRSTSSSRG